MSKIIILSDEDRDALCLAVEVYREERGLEESPEWDRLAKLLKKAPSEHTIRIVIRSNTVEHVEKLPMGFSYEVQDLDKCDKCGGLEPLCGWCVYSYKPAPTESYHDGGL